MQPQEAYNVSSSAAAPTSTTPTQEQRKTTSWLGRKVEGIKDSTAYKALERLIQKIASIFSGLKEKITSLTKEGSQPSRWSGVPYRAVSDNARLPFNKPHTSGVFSIAKDELEGLDPAKTVTIDISYKGKVFERHVEPGSLEKFDIFSANLPLNKEVTVKIYQEDQTFANIAYTPNCKKDGFYTANKVDGEWNVQSTKVDKDTIMVSESEPTTIGTGSPTPSNVSQLTVFSEHQFSIEHNRTDKNKIFTVVNHSEHTHVLTMTLWNGNANQSVAFPIVINAKETKVYPTDLLHKAWEGAHNLYNDQKPVEPFHCINWLDDQIIGAPIKA